MSHVPTTQHRTSRRTVGLTTAVAATALTGLGLLSPAAGATARTAEPVTTTERGVVLECTGSRHGLDAYVSLYENNLHGNVVQVILDGDPARAASREPRDILSAGEVRTGVRIGEHRVRIRGTAHRVPVSKRTPVHEVMDDAGQHIVVDGFHRRLVNDLVLRYDGTRVPLTCAPAFAYRLTVTKTDITGG
jgi:hypothetical protein